MNQSALKSKFIGALIGTAIGDAIGMPFLFYMMHPVFPRNFTTNH